MDEQMIARMVAAAEGWAGVDEPRRVLVVCGLGPDARQVVDRALGRAAVDRRRVERSVRAHGEERIEFASGGRIDFTSTRSARHRGMDADLVIVAPDALTAPDVMSSVLATLATSRRPELWTMAGPVDVPALGRMLGAVAPQKISAPA